MMKMKGIDVSGYQGVDVYERYKPDFCMIKATEGVGYVSDGLYSHIEAYTTYAQKAQKIRCMGFYHYARPETGNTPKEECDSFLKETLKYKGLALYALDWEGAALQYPISWAKEFIERVADRTGSIPFIYMSASVSREKQWESDFLSYEKCRLWVAHYGVSTPNYGGHWPTWSMWQHTSDPIDKDIFHAGTDGWAALAQGKQNADDPYGTWRIAHQEDGKIVLEWTE